MHKYSTDGINPLSLLQLHNAFWVLTGDDMRPIMGSRDEASEAFRARNLWWTREIGQFFGDFQFMP